MVPRKAARFVFNDFSTYSSVTAMLQELNWHSLQDRRIQSVFYKIINNLVDVDFTSYLIPSVSQTGGHHFKFRQLHTRINSFQSSFLPATICEWNSLPANVVNSVDVEQFTEKLNNLY